MSWQLSCHDLCKICDLIGSLESKLAQKDFSQDFNYELFNPLLRQSDTFIAWLAPSHYLNQCWNIVNWTSRNKLQWNFSRNSWIFIHQNPFENVIWKMAAILSWPQCVKWLPVLCYIVFWTCVSMIHNSAFRCNTSISIIQAIVCVQLVCTV